MCIVQDAGRERRLSCGPLTPVSQRPAPEEGGFVVAGVCDPGRAFGTLPRPRPEGLAMPRPKPLADEPFACAADRLTVPRLAEATDPIVAGYCNNGANTGTRADLLTS